MGGKRLIVQSGSTHSSVPFEHFYSKFCAIIIEICFYFVVTPNYTVQLEIPKKQNFLLTSERLILKGPSCMVRLLTVTDTANEENVSFCEVSVQFLHYFL